VLSGILSPKELLGSEVFGTVDRPHQVNLEEGIGENSCYPGEPPNHDC